MSCKARVPADHPLRPIRAIVDEALEFLSPANVLCPGRLVSAWMGALYPRHRLCQGAPWIMDMKLHANATTTPKVRNYIQRSQAPVAELVAEFGVSETTIRKAERAGSFFSSLLAFINVKYAGLTNHPSEHYQPIMHDYER